MAGNNTHTSFHMKTKLRLRLLALFAMAGIVFLLMLIDPGNATPSMDDQSGCDREGCHPSDDSRYFYDLDIETAPYTQEETDKFHVTVKDANGDKWQHARAAEACRSANGGENDTVFNSFDNSSEGSWLNISEAVRGGGIEDGESVNVWAGYKTNESGNDTWHFGSARYTYERPNTPPVAVAGLSLTEEGNPEEKVTALLTWGYLTVFFNATGCYDDDGDEIQKYLWDLTGTGTFENKWIYCDNGSCGDCGDGNETDCDYEVRELLPFFEMDFDEPGNYTFHFRCCDGEDWSDVVEVGLQIDKPEERPDLTFDSHVIVMTREGSHGLSIYKTNVMTFIIENKGNDDLREDLEIKIFYSYKPCEDDDWGDWEEMYRGDITIRYNKSVYLKAGGTKTVTFEWRPYDFDLETGHYRFKLIIDPEDDIEEYLENKTLDMSNEIWTKGFYFDLSYPPQYPEFSLEDFTAPDSVYVQDLVTCTVVVVNSGDGDGYCRVFLFVDGVECANSQRRTVLAEDSEVFTVDWRAEIGTHSITMKLDYKGEYLEETEELTIRVEGYDDPPYPPGEPPWWDKDGDGLPDSWEEKYFGFIYAYGASDDPDEDGYTNLEEYNANSDPTNPESCPAGPPEDDTKENTHLETLGDIISGITGTATGSPVFTPMLAAGLTFIVGMGILWLMISIGKINLKGHETRKQESEKGEQELEITKKRSTSSGNNSSCSLNEVPPPPPLVITKIAGPGYDDIAEEAEYDNSRPDADDPLAIH